MSRCTMRCSCAVVCATLARCARAARRASPERQGTFAQARRERGPAHELHGDPQEPVVFGAERIDMRREGMVEQRSQARRAHEPLADVIGGLVARMQHLDDRLAAEQRLLRSVHGSKAAFADLFLDQELTEGAPLEIG